MKTPTKFVKPLTSEQRDQLKEIMKSPASQRKRMRAHAILLSERRYSIDQIADIYQVDRDRVSQWLDWWEEFRFDGLDDDPRGGRPPKLNPEKQQRAIEIVREEPRSTKQGLQRIADEIGKVISGDTLKPCGPDAWQLVGERLELASTHGPRQNLLGSFNLHHQFHSCACEGTINSHVVTGCFDLFS